ncbi:hypothetical protein Q0O37_13995, partial [Staphylococcus aureus]|nr:hypothetical protein [Staphylococcus aureus]
MTAPESEYRVSLVYKILAGSAEEIVGFFSRAIDKMMSQGHSQLQAPDFFYKAIMYAGLSSIDDTKAKD